MRGVDGDGEEVAEKKTETTLENWWHSKPISITTSYAHLQHKQQDTNGTNFRRKFTPYLVRMSILLTTYDFCVYNVSWPPLHETHSFLFVLVRTF